VFVVPLDMIEECIEYATEPGQDYTNLRGQVLPLVRLRELFRIGGAARGARASWCSSSATTAPAWWSIRCWANSRP
jgi:chemotaxis protein histidine kinase CheA